MIVSNKRRCRVWSRDYGDGQKWYRGSVIGRGGYSCVFLASFKDSYPTLDEKKVVLPSQMAAKSADLSDARSLREERTVFRNMGACPYIIRCFGSETTTGEKATTYNLLLEYGSGGALDDKIKKSSRGLPESEVKLHALSILKGLRHIHRSGYIHCDLKPENVLLVANKGGGFTAKIADFGLAVKREEYKALNKKIGAEYKAFINRKRKSMSCPYWRGTFDYMSPEAVVFGMQFPCSDIWSFGCTVLEMLTGKPAWQKKTDNSNKELSSTEIIDRIRTKDALPEIPDKLSKEAKSFLKLCLVRNPVHRSGANSLLYHSFFKGIIL